MAHETAEAPSMKPGVDSKKGRGGGPRTAKAGFSGFVLVCAKCAKRQGYRKGAASRSLKRALKARWGGKARIEETRCLGPCPRRLLTIATPESLSRGRLLLIDPALREADLDALAPRLREKPTLGPPPDMRYRSPPETDAAREDT